MAATAIRNVPIPKLCLPMVGHILYFVKSGGCVNKTLSALQKNYGDTFELRVPFGKYIATRDPKLMRLVYTNKNRPVTWSLDLVTKMNRWPQDIVNARGPRWEAYRKVLNKSFMLKSQKGNYKELVEEKATHLVEAIKNNIGPDGRLKDISINELIAMYAFEVSIRTFIGEDEPVLPVSYERPAGKISTKDAMHLSNLVMEMFEGMHKFETAPFGRYQGEHGKEYKAYESAWYEIVDYTDRLFDPHVDLYLKERRISETAERALILPHLLRQMDAEDFNERLTPDEVKWVIRFAFVASIDTTSQTFEHLMYRMGTASDEVRSTLNKDLNDHPVCGESPYMLACLRESMRLTPTIPVNSRELATDLTFTNAEGAEMNFPAGTSFLLDHAGVCLNENNFENATEFNPSRFLRDSRKNHRSANEESVEAAASGCPFHAKKLADGGKSPDESFETFAANIQFGHGRRRCPGAGLGQSVLNSAFDKIARSFDIKYDGPPLDTFNRALARPKNPVSPHLTFTLKSA